MAEFIETTLMDGFADGPHVTEVQIGLANQAVIGPDDYVLEGGRESEAQVLTNNSIRIFDGVYCIQGRRDVIPANGYTDVTIANGSQSMNRNDIIVRRYRKDESSEIETTEYAVIKGTPSSGTAVDPKVTIGDIRSGATLHEMALYRVKLTGLNITAVEPMFNILKNMATLQKEFAELNSNSIKNFISPDVDTEKLGCVEFFNGLKIVFGSVKCNYKNPNVLSGGAKFPVVFSQAPCFTTGVGNIGNTYDELSRNAKTKICTTSINIALHDPSSKFSAGTYYYVNFVAIGV